MANMQTEALRIALEALELHGKQYPHMVKGYCLDAITAIKQALAAPVQSCYCLNCEEMGRELAALKAQPAPVQDEDLYDLAVKADNGGQP